MGNEDLGNCIIISRNDFKKLKINIDDLEKICDSMTPSYMQITQMGVRKKLRNYIEKQANKFNADVALIQLQFDNESLPFDLVSYSFSLYKYKN